MIFPSVGSWLGVLAMTMPLAVDSGEVDRLRTVQTAMRQAIQQAEPAVACVLVSRSARYQDFEPGSRSRAPGELGRFPPKTLEPQSLTGPHRQLLRRLDLQDPETVPPFYGSGVVIDAAGYVLTPYHLVQGARKVYVRLPDGNGSYANVHAADSRSDLAVLRLLDPPKQLRAISLGQAEQTGKGDWILALASSYSPNFADIGPAAAWGILADVRQPARATDDGDSRLQTLHTQGTLLQLDTPVWKPNPRSEPMRPAPLGNTGGAVLNLDGELIGVLTTAAVPVDKPQARGYAIPMDQYFRRIVRVLREGREVEYGFLGVSTWPPDQLPVDQDFGVSLRLVTPGSPAAAVGLRGGDIILRVDGTPIRGMNDLFLTLGGALAGNEVAIDVRSVQTGRVGTVRPRLVKFRYPGDFIASNRPEPVHGLHLEYTSVLSESVANASIPTGVLVRGVEPNTPAAAKLKDQLEANAPIVITSVNGQVVTTPEEFRNLAAKSVGPLELQIKDPTQNHSTQTLILP